uniref:NADH-ubiquinone oxidoreductase chain 5 n=1 Tax=Trachys variolaris TaxID=2823040 RepID=A0A8A6W536_9COLE|nr:NADH dehydrogenase subunit 5 [Trachys variolaris]QTK22443.1 NADH dehydrogenase subunit 5 [Trachys variolaris]
MLSICLVYSSMFFFFSLILFSSGVFCLSQDLCYFIEFEVASINSCLVVMSLLFDWMSLFFMSFVLFISAMVVYYSDDYMHGDLTLNRFIILVSLFVLSMMLLIISPNMISILLGWDGLGLVSYCLVIYYQNEKSSNAGMLTALSNRVGDVAILLTIAWMLNYGSWSYIFYMDCINEDPNMLFISYLVVLAAMTKSAQIPFSSWLPAAMAAPTPVSSLVHSSTLVTAGVYLLIRFSNCLDSTVMSLLLIVSSLTMFMSGLSANYETDLKKIIALSTLSQLGLMISIISLGESSLGFFHLLSHALFKALLFMCAGSFIHNLINCQDIRYMGCIFISMPLTCVLFNICNLSLCGLPFLAGFYSKDLILESVSMMSLNIVIYFIYFVSTGLTVSYSIRLFYYSMFGDFNFLSFSALNKESLTMLTGMLGLIMLVVTGGSFLSWLIMPFPYFICLSFFMKMMTLFVVLLGGWIGYQVSLMELSKTLPSLSSFRKILFVALMWNMPFLSTVGFNFTVLSSGSLYYKFIDQGWLEYIGSQNIYNNLTYLSLKITKLFSNSLKNLLMIFIILIIMMVIFL